MILLFGGTTEGRLAADNLQRKGQPFIYSVKDSGALHGLDYANMRYGALNPEGLEAFIEERHIRKVIDAAHPFAVQLHKTVQEVCNRKKIFYLRYCRPSLDRIQHENIRYVQNWESLWSDKFSIKGPVLAMSGVNTIGHLKPIWEKEEVYFRILDRKSSIYKAKKQGLSESNLILGRPESEVEELLKLIGDLKIRSLLTKESGKEGGLHIKIKAAVKTGTPLFILERPEIPGEVIQIYDLQDL
ncbi:precorrin-6A reductase [Xanthovirga aplysinae]|uniref:precorrin-6A reductase n=1 Tax=Xanthovirga aplysinae TaxID=2529853 RepID=UPI0012BC884D|nr:precorrin-6A reductase [Xanthovirga aplysinae]MTI33551.1 precorrin-6A reductase [Xanthovirga aplysinae]